jgi:prepilin-type N-terminal cleavage/methylation domain-containing protein
MIQNNIKLNRVKGFSLIELAIVLVVTGVILSTVQVFYSESVNVTKEVKLKAQLEAINQSLIIFAMKNKRLPCADTNGDGYEGSASSDCGTGAANQTGAVPYKTLEMNQMGNVQTNLEKRNILYGVYRRGNVTASDDADLVVLKERTGDTLTESQYYQNNFDFIKALSNANNNVFNNNNIYTAGNETTVNCATANDNYAYILTSSGVDDMDNDGNVFDGVNKDIKLDGTGTNCFSSAKQRKNKEYDDIVFLMHFQSLIGRLNTIN